MYKNNLYAYPYSLDAGYWMSYYGSKQQVHVPKGMLLPDVIQEYVCVCVCMFI
jgi:hypothetical protein